MGSYSTITWGALKTQLANFLGDSGKVFWGDTELEYYLGEALRLWNVLTGFHRTRGTFSTSAGVAFYDIPALLVDSGAALVRAYTLRDRHLIKNIQYHLLEPPLANGSSTWTGTSMFTVDEVVRAIERARNRYLLDTHAVLTHSTDSPDAPPNGDRVTFTQTMMDITRVSWKTAEGRYHLLHPDDERRALTARRAQYGEEDVPYAFAMSTTPTLELLIIPPPASTGTVELLSVTAPTDLDPSATAHTGILLNVPDDHTWIVKWEAMAILLAKDGLAQDLNRAAFCSQMYKLGVEMAAGSPVVLAAQINGRPTIPDALARMDRVYPRWQSQSGTPSKMALAGLNLLALAKVPDASTHSVTLDVVANTPVPAAGSDATNVQIGREHIEPVLAAAKALAVFKEGPHALEVANLHFRQMFEAAGGFGLRLAAKSPAVASLLGLSHQERSARPFHGGGGERSGGGSEDTASERTARRGKRSSNYGV